MCRKKIDKKNLLSGPWGGDRPAFWRKLEKQKMGDSSIDEK